MRGVLSWFSRDKDVVEVDDDLSFINLESEYFVHHGLEGRRGICESEEHDGGFVKPVIGTKSGFVLIPFFYPDIVVSPSHIKFGEVLGILECVNEFGY